MLPMIVATPSPPPSSPTPPTRPPPPLRKGCPLSTFRIIACCRRHQLPRIEQMRKRNMATRKKTKLLHKGCLLCCSHYQLPRSQQMRKQQWLPENRRNCYLRVACLTLEQIDVCILTITLLDTFCCMPHPNSLMLSLCEYRAASWERYSCHQSCNAIS